MVLTLHTITKKDTPYQKKHTITTQTSLLHKHTYSQQVASHWVGTPAAAVQPDSTLNVDDIPGIIFITVGEFDKAAWDDMREEITQFWTESYGGAPQEFPLMVVVCKTWKVWADAAKAEKTSKAPFLFSGMAPGGAGVHGGAIREQWMLPLGTTAKLDALV